MKKKWSDDFVRFGFTKKMVGDEVRPQCFTCGVVLSNESLRESKLRQHWNTVHGGIGDENEMKQKRARFDQKGTLVAFNFVPHKSPILRASYEVSYLIAKEKAAFTSGEKLIKPSAIKMAEIVLGKEAKKKMEEVPLSNDVVQSRICDMSDDVLNQVVSAVKASPIRVSLQLDESTDVANVSQLIVFVRFVEGEKIFAVISCSAVR